MSSLAVGDFVVISRDNARDLCHMQGIPFGIQFVALVIIESEEWAIAFYPIWRILDGR